MFHVCVCVLLSCRLCLGSSQDWCRCLTTLRRQWRSPVETSLMMLCKLFLPPFGSWMLKVMAPIAHPHPQIPRSRPLTHPLCGVILLEGGPASISQGPSPPSPPLPPRPQALQQAHRSSLPHTHSAHVT